MKVASLALQKSYFFTIFYQESRYIGTGQTIVAHSPLGQFDTAKSASALTKQILSIDEDMPLYFKEVKGAKYQLGYLKHIVGFNVSQLAAILRVKRPTIYEWLENKEPNRTNQERLDVIYSLFNVLGKEKIGIIGNYFYKKIDKNKSLYDFLVEEIINEVLAKEYILKIKEMLLANKRLNIKREELLAKAGFKPINREQKEQALKRLVRKL